MQPREQGMSAVELSVVVALLSILASAAAPELATWRAQQAVLGAGGSLILQIEGVRASAAGTRRAHALVFRPIEGRADWAVAVDGDGDGVRGDDLANGTDPLRAAGRALAEEFPGVTLGLAPAVTPVPGGARPRGDFPMAPTGILTASPDGTLSTGTVYLCHRKGVCFAARVYGPGGRVGGWSYRAGRWRRRW